ncbi:MAG: hypothetical protein AAB438_02380 [Patescibacteria group bacterium]
MLKARLILILGIWVAILPYLGFPYSIKNILFSLTGLVIIYTSFVIYKELRLKKVKPTSKKFDSFLENNSFKAEQQSEVIEQI